MIQQYFSQILKFSQIKEGGPNFLRGANSADWLNYLVAPSVIQFHNYEGSKFFVIS